MKHIMSGAFILTAVILATAVCLIALYSGKNADNENTSACESSAGESQNGGFLLGEYNGRIAVFADGSNVPIKVFDISVDSLPEIDRAALESGIHAADSRELEVLITDYTS